MALPSVPLRRAVTHPPLLTVTAGLFAILIILGHVVILGYAVILGHIVILG
jgi:hypothetical protein